MGTYIFYTDEGYTIAPNGEELDSLQILGIEDGKSKEEALSNLFENNRWIRKNNFSELSMRCYAILKPEIAEKIKAVIDCLWKDEERNRERNRHRNEHLHQLLEQIKDCI